MDKSLSPPRALVFDAYGTLFDVHSVVELCDELWPGKGLLLSQLWRAKQLEYSWLRSLMRRYQDFAQVTDAALGYACAALGLALDSGRRRRLIAAYRELATFPEVLDALAALKASKIRLAILSNGSPAMLRPLVAHAGLGGLIGTVLSVDPGKIYKPAPAVYRLAVTRLRVPKRSIGFVSSNCWDACGAKSFGFRTYWINRSGAPVDALGVVPDHVIRGLDELQALVRVPAS
ncbi:MAG TPA: haloacid dehalogenase type II [Burkholderiales bacterium]|nr:haloacid dehalogenase type II [Burkholderiales bacterium]